MNIFDTILQKLGIQKPATPTKIDASVGATVGTPKTASNSAPMNQNASIHTTPSAAVGTPAGQAVFNPTHPTAVPMVDVMSKLESLARSHPGLDWRVSIADLLQLLDMENSYEARKELAAELGCPENLMHDSASMNVWLHKTVLEKIAENGGNVPASLMHA